MIINDPLLTSAEKVLFSLRGLYAAEGYRSYKMNKFEEYDLYARNKEFLVSDNVITFTDTNGKLMALKPDVTLSIVKNRKDDPAVTDKLFYNENVYRVSKDNDSYREIMQIGIECIGKIDDSDILGVLRLASKSLGAIAEKSVLDVSSLAVLESVAAYAGIPGGKNKRLFKAISDRNIHEIDEISAEAGADTAKVEILKKLVSLHGSIPDVLPRLEKLIRNDEVDNFISVMKQLVTDGLEDSVKIDFSVAGDTNYYNGIIFKGFIDGVPAAVLSGGQYDRLMKKLKKKSKAIGFAVYTDALERIDFTASSDTDENDGYINIALPKGRLGDKVYEMFASCGYECPAILEQNRKLVFENPAKKVRYFWVKPSDVAIYVERGAADIGVAGKDILLEYEPDVYELLDLNIGKCRMAVAAPVDFTDDMTKTLRVATKFSNIAKKYYRTTGRDIDIIHLNGSIEIAPILGLSDVIFDIVETGRTLKENNLEVKEIVVPISARLISNKASFKFKSGEIETLAKALESVVPEDKND